MPRRSSKLRTSDESAIARSILDEIIEFTESDDFNKEPPQKNPAAVALGRMGGLKGGSARAMSLSAEQRSEIARKAAIARWNKRDDS